ncbi:MAG: DNA repair protein RadC [Acidobacteria bacterium]|nr:MAG: DNA repair protein RadC [Acidobacteriota bacterium]
MRPREKLVQTGLHPLNDQELLALVLGHGVRGRGALRLASDLLAAIGGIHGIARTSADQLATETGIGPATAARIVAAVELGRRTLQRQPEPRTRFANARDLAAYLMPMYGASPIERFGVVLVDTKHQLIRVRVLSVGSSNAVTAEPREVYRDALLAGAAGVIVFHNHPTGDPTPSRDDLALTERLANAGRVVGVELVDHLIVGDARYFSMRERGVIQ